MILKIFEKFVK